MRERCKKISKIISFIRYTFHLAVLSLVYFV